MPNVLWAYVKANIYHYYLGEPSSNLSCGSKVGFQKSVDILLKHTKKIPENQAELQPLLSLIQEKNVNLVLQRKGLPINGDVCKKVSQQYVHNIGHSSPPHHASSTHTELNFVYLYIGMENTLSAF